MVGNAFQDRCLKPLGHPSVGASVAHSTASFKPATTSHSYEKKPRSEYRAGLKVFREETQPIALETL
jgi:hypothetical protein